MPSCSIAKLINRNGLLTKKTLVAKNKIKKYGWIGSVAKCNIKKREKLKLMKNKKIRMN